METVLKCVVVQSDLHISMNSYTHTVIIPYHKPGGSESVAKLFNQTLALSVLLNEGEEEPEE